jgi:hypothetical protein
MRPLPDDILMLKLLVFPLRGIPIKALAGGGRQADTAT